jgi:hypothetical protein
VPDLGPERTRDDLCVVGEARGGVAPGPAAAIDQRLRKVPVVQRDEWADAGVVQRTDQALVVIDSLRIRRAAAIGLDARPGNRKAVRADVQPAHQRDIVEIAMIAVAGDIAVVAVLHFAGRVREAIPHRFATSVVLDRSFDLVGRRGDAPAKAARERRAGSRRCQSATIGEQRTGERYGRLQDLATPHVRSACGGGQLGGETHRRANLPIHCKRNDSEARMRQRALRVNFVLPFASRSIVMS